MYGYVASFNELSQLFRETRDPVQVTTSFVLPTVSHHTGIPSMSLPDQRRGTTYNQQLDTANSVILSLPCIKHAIVIKIAMWLLFKPGMCVPVAHAHLIS